MKTRENTQNRGQPPKTSPIEQITDRWEPKNSPLQRVTLQTLRACFFYGSERTVDSNESAGEAIRFTQRTLPGKNKILCAWRADIPEILEIFPILSQDVGINFALSRRRAPA